MPSLHPPNVLNSTVRSPAAALRALAGAARESPPAARQAAAEAALQDGRRRAVRRRSTAALSGDAITPQQPMRVRGERDESGCQSVRVSEIEERN